MKRVFLTLLCCLAAWSCNMEGSFSAKNAWDFVTVAQGKLVSDTGAVYTVSDVPKDAPALEEGKRYYVVFDILNINYEVSITSVTPIRIVVPTLESPQEEITAHDPVEVLSNWIGPNYIDIMLSYYYDEKSSFEHDIFGRYTISNGDTILSLSLYHDGNDENPSAMDEKLLKKENAIISIPVSQWELVSATISLDILTQGTDGSYKVERKTFSSAITKGLTAQKQ